MGIFDVVNPLPTDQAGGDSDEMRRRNRSRVQPLSWFLILLLCGFSGSRRKRETPGTGVLHLGGSFTFAGRGHEAICVAAKDTMGDRVGEV